MPGSDPRSASARKREMSRFECEYYRELSDIMFEKLPAALVVYAPREDVVVRTNPAHQSLTGFAPEETVGLRGGDLFHPVDLRRAREKFLAMEDVGSGEALPGCGLRAARRSAPGYADGEFAVRILKRSGEGDADLWLCVCWRDAKSVTERRVKAAGERLAMIMDVFEDGIWEYDVPSRMFYYGAQAILYQRTVPEHSMSQAEFVRILHPADAEFVLKAWEDHIRHGVPYRVECRIMRKGSYHNVLSTAHAVSRFGDGRPRRIMGLIVDVTELRKTQQNLAAAEERFRLIFENAGLGVAVVDPGGRIEKANPALAILLGRNRDRLVGTFLNELVDPADAPAMLEFFERVTSAGTSTLTREGRVRKDSGETLWIRVTATRSHKGDDDDFIVLLFEDITERRRTNIKLWHEANHDPLTGAWNRGVLFERLEQHIVLSRRTGLPLTFCMCDLDEFKKVNDAHGHQTGDEVLVRFVKVLRQEVRGSDLVGRYGGEEFGIVFPDTGVEGATACLERARRTMARTTFSGADGAPLFSVSATFGVAALRKGDTAESMVNAADRALYKGKRGGRNRIVVFSPEEEAPDEKRARSATGTMAKGM